MYEDTPIYHDEEGARLNIGSGGTLRSLAGAIINLALGTVTLPEGQIRYAEVALTNAQIKALRATPITLVAAPGAHKFVEFISAQLLLDYGSEVLTRPNADEDLVIKYNNGAGAVVSSVSDAGFPVAAADSVNKLVPAAAALLAAAAVENLALVLHNDGTGEFAGNASNDTVLRVKVAYRVHATGF